MRIYTTSVSSGVPTGIQYPAMLLRADRWDDFGYKTMYQAEYLATRGDAVFIGAVKVMQEGQHKSSSPTPLPHEVLSLDPTHCSLGQAPSYYENLVDLLSASDVGAYLVQMQDLVGRPDRIELFENDICFETSLMRETGARRALEDGPDLIAGRSLDTNLEFSFNTNVGGEAFETHFVFGDTDAIPSRLNAVIGYNGAGKTQLLVNIAHVAWGDDKHRGRVAAEFGVLHPGNIAFGRVVAVSYSAFDTFKTPSSTEEPSVAVRSYAYCGLREFSDQNNQTLKGQKKLADEIENSIRGLRTSDRWESLHAALDPLLREPSFQLSGVSLDFQEDPATWRPRFETLSTGHKISLNIVIQLVAQLENKSLVLIDEPESHLHPPLLSSLMKGISAALERTNSFGIVATHSPVVLQEVAKKYVQVMRRSGRITTIEKPPMETFGENIGILTRSIFNLNNSESDYEGVLAELAETHGSERIMDIFPEGLSSQALGILLQNERAEGR